MFRTTGQPRQPTDCILVWNFSRVIFISWWKNWRDMEVPCLNIQLISGWIGSVKDKRLMCKRFWNREEGPKLGFQFWGMWLGNRGVWVCVCVFGETAALWVVTTFEEIIILQWWSSSKDIKYNTALLVQMRPNKVDFKKVILLELFHRNSIIKSQKLFFFNFLALKWHKGCLVDQPLFFS